MFVLDQGRPGSRGWAARTSTVALWLVGLVACSGGGTGGSDGGAAAGRGGSAGGGTAGTAGVGGSSGGRSGGGNDAGPLDAAACGCVLHGKWTIDNLSPCFFNVTGDANVSGAISTVSNGSQVACPNDLSMAPSAPWSTDTLAAACPGHYRLCLTLKAGSAASPQASDCALAQSCAEGDYTGANQPETWPTLPSWIATGAQQACAEVFQDSGGYGELTITGTPTGCAAVTQTIGTTTYCPLSCNGANPPAACASCVAGGSNGSF